MEKLQEKLDQIVQNRKKQLEQQTEQVRKNEVKIADEAVKNLDLFKKLKAKIRTFSGQVHQALLLNEDSLVVMDNENASAKEDIARNFINIHVFPKGFSYQQFGVSTPGLYIDCDVEKGLLTIRRKLSFYSPTTGVIEEAAVLANVEIANINEVILETIVQILEYGEVPRT